MTETKALTTTQYKKLLKDLSAIITKGRRAVEHTLLTMYWNTGKRLSTEKLPETSGYKDGIVKDLAEDLAIDLWTLNRTLLFFEAYHGGVPVGTPLVWSHYRELAAIRDAEERDFYEQAAIEHGWGRNDLLQAMRENRYEEAKEKGKTSLVTVTRLKRPTKGTYVYKAKVMRVIDGDTLLLLMDLGFKTYHEDRIRLAQIDCPEMDTDKGYEAYEYVRDQMVKAQTIVIRSTQLDLHGRYVADLFYSFRDERKQKVFDTGRYLNQELMDKGLAKRI